MMKSKIFFGIFLLFSVSCNEQATSIDMNIRPNCSISVSPDSGGSSTYFYFTAICNDYEDPDSVLKVRWDFENDGIWNTEYSTWKSIFHKYSSGGIKTIKLEVKDSGGLINSTKKQLTLSNSTPGAYFLVSPESGDINTIFYFYPQASFDYEDPDSVLQIRWDWENDGVWDTNYSMLERAIHMYASGGIKTIILEVKDSGGLVDTSMKQVTIANNIPTADFKITPTVGDISTSFNFDASGSSDKEDPVAALQVRWDWENDGIWDTNFSMNMTKNRRYSSDGFKVIKMEVKDTGGLTNIITRRVIVTISDSVTDIDGNTYKTVKIGDQWWMTENLKVTHYRNNDLIENVQDANVWLNLSCGAYCEYNNNSANVSVFGRLYNYYTLSDSRGVAPEGWHVSTYIEWETLINNLGGRSVAGGKMKEIGTLHWKEPNGEATNESGFSALPGGYRGGNGVFYDKGFFADFWFPSENDSFHPGYHHLLYYNGTILKGYTLNKNNAYSIRCVKDQ